MVKALLALLDILRSAWLIELVGAGLIVAACAITWGTAAALAAAGTGLILKAFEIDTKTGDR